jgi:hypothetical protein
MTNLYSSNKGPDPCGYAGCILNGLRLLSQCGKIGSRRGPRRATGKAFPEHIFGSGRDPGKGGGVVR